jgi:sulfatase modifying factor 1
MRAALGTTVVVLSLFTLGASGSNHERSDIASARSSAERPTAACIKVEPTDQVWVPGGKFQFGTDGAHAEEGPARPATVNGFWIDRHEVTNAQFARFVADTHYVTVAERNPDPRDYPGIAPEKLVPGSAVFTPPADGMVNTVDPSGWWTFVQGANWRHPNGPGSSIAEMDHLPVVDVAYDDALAYAQWAGRDLPTEAEWDFAARGGHQPTLGDDKPTADVGPDGRYRGNTWQGLFPLVNERKDGYKGLAPVGCFPPNGYGLYDMIGNAWEWTSSYYHPSHRDAAPGSFDDPRQPGVPVRVIKGGSFLCARNFCWRYRPTSRQAQDAGFTTGHIGFRTVARERG